MICVFCAQDGMEVRWDKKGRPYLRCDACSAKAFTRGSLSIAVYQAFAEALEGVNVVNLREVAQARLPALTRTMRNEVDHVDQRQPARTQR